MLKFIRGKGYVPSAERLKLQKELFGFNKTVQHGFPHRPSALAWDPELKLMVLGTRTGTIKVFGTPGVEFYGQHAKDCSVMQIFCLNNQGRFISLCDDNSMHLWEINEKDGKQVLEEKKSCSLEGRLKKISTCCLESSGENLLIGTEGGNIYLLDVKSFDVSSNIIYQDVVMQNVSSDYRVNPGPVEAIAEHPTDPDKILIGYNRGLLVLWDKKNLVAEQTYITNQQLESVCWHRKGDRFISSHNDGSYIKWDASDPLKSSTPVTQYGPFPCKGISKILWRSAKGEDFIIFAGGMPRAPWSDKNTVAVLNGDKQVVFDFTSKIVDFFTISDNDQECELDDPHSLVVLAEEEIVVLDLHDENWAPYRAPDLASLHSSAITCSQHFSNIPENLWQKLIDVGNSQTKDPVSSRDWPISGGKNLVPEPKSRDLLLTGHEDGTVHFWDASGVSLRHVYKVSTSTVFIGEDGHDTSLASNNEQNQGDEVEDWPPFRKVGCFDPYSDDPRLAIRKISLCPEKETFVVAGTAGQVLVMSFSTTETEKEVETSLMNIVNDRDGFVWKGHDRLILKKGPLKFAPGFSTDVVLQMHPPAAVTALASHAEWGLVAAGTAHGFGLFDYLQNKPVTSKCTLNPNDLTGAGDATMARRKSFKKSLRESFRRLRRGRSRRSPEKSPTRDDKRDGNKTDGVVEVRQSESPPPVDPKPVERAVEARGTDDTSGPIVRCLYLVKTYIVNSATQLPTLWAGTNNGAIYVFTVRLPAPEKRNEVAVNCSLGKEIQLRHRAPVVSIVVVDAAGVPVLVEGYAKAPATSGSPAGNHRVVISSEEQFKVFTLPSLKPYGKFKLTAHEGSRIRKVGFLTYHSLKDANYSESCLTCLTNQGDLSIFTVPDLRRQVIHNCIRREDINGISSLTFTQYGQGFYLHSSSEYQRFSLSAANVTMVQCLVELPPGVRASVQPAVEAENEKIKVEEEDEETVEVSPQELSGIKEEDITLDSVTDHTVTTKDETTITRITEHTEQKVEVKREETIMTIETRVLTSELAVVED